MLLFREALTLALPQPAQSSNNRPVQVFGVVAVVDESGADLEDCEHAQSILSTANAIRAVKKTRAHPQLDIDQLHLQSDYSRIKDCEPTQPIVSTSNAIRTVKRYDARASSTRHQAIAFAIGLCKHKGL